MDSPLFIGSAAALVTPFSRGQIDFDALARLIDFQLTHHSDALTVCATTGEAPTLTQNEKDSILSFTLERVNGRVPVIMGTGANNTACAVAQTKRAQVLGAQGALVVTPYYNKTTQRGLIAHYTAVADSTPLPLILYNVPSRTGLNMLPETAAQLAEHPNIIGIKEACTDISQISELARLTCGRLALYSGNDDMVLPVLALGGIGVISACANVIPAKMHALTAAWHAGQINQARKIQLDLLPLCRALFSEVNPIPVKAALRMMGLCSDEVRLPLVPMSEEKSRPLGDVLQSLGLPTAPEE